MGFVRLPGVVNLSLPRPEVATTRVHADDVAAIVHTSGATGPAKAVVYTHGALVAQRSPMDALLGDHTTGAFTTSFAGFSLLAPALQRPYVRPNVAIGEPSKLGFDELHELTVKRSIHVAWLSPASARQLVATANKRTLPLRTMLLAGAPISPELARAVGEVTNGTVLAPYGMTECLPITSGEGAQEIHPSGGVIVGSPLHHATVRLRNLATGELVAHPSDLGEILVHAPWMYTTYDQRYEANEEATLTIDGVRFHATGDVGLFDQENLVVLGRRRDVLHTVNGPVPPLAIEGPVGRALGRDVAVVGVGPTGAQVAAVVVHSSNTRLALAPPELAEAVRDAAPLPIAAVMTKRLPVDHRHQSKVDHLALRNSVEAFLTES
jgi:acyl-CoA synthetase (AMP-forming)/AMP-acid ligase II